MITKERLYELFEYDPDTGVFLRKRGPRKVGALTYDGYLRAKVDHKFYLVHRMAWLYTFGYLPVALDHINRVRTDNRICNLRVATVAENAQNVLKHRDNTSGALGVTFCKQTRKWRAKINGKCLGRYADWSDAVVAYNTAKELLHPFRPKN